MPTDLTRNGVRGDSLWRCLRNHWPFLLFWCILFLVHLVTISWVPDIMDDEPVHSEISRSLWETGTLHVPSLPLTYGRHEGHYYLFCLVQAPFVGLLGFTLFAMRLPILLCFMCSLVFFYLYWCRAWNRSVARWFVLLYSFAFSVFYASHVARPESPILFFLALGLWLSTWRFNWKTTFLVGAVGTFGFWVHIPGLLVPFALGFVVFGPRILRTKWPLREMAGYCAGCLLVAGLYFTRVSVSDFLWALTGPVGDANRPYYGRYLGYLANWPRTFVRFYLSWEFAPYLALWTSVLGWGAWKLRWYSSTSKAAPFLCGLLGTTVLLVVLGRASRMYHVYFVVWTTGLFVIAAWHIADKWLRNTVLTTAVLLNVGYVAGYVNLFTNVNVTSFDQTLQHAIPNEAVVLCRNGHHVALANHQKVYYYWDVIFHAGRSGARLPLKDYVAQLSVEYLIVDDEVREVVFPQIPEMERFLEEYTTVEKRFEVEYGGYRVFEKGGYPFSGIIKYYFYNIILLLEVFAV